MEVGLLQREAKASIASMGTGEQPLCLSAGKRISLEVRVCVRVCMCVCVCMFKV